MVEVVRLLVDLQGAAQGSPAGYDDDQDDDELDHAEEVLETETPFQREAVDQECGGDAGEADAALVPPVDFHVGSVQDVLAEDDGVGACPSEEDYVPRVQSCRQELRLTVHVLEVVLLSAVARDGGAELEVNGHAGGGDEHACDPDEEGEPDAAGEREDGAGGCEDSRADHAVEDEEDGGCYAYLTLCLANLEEGALVDVVGWSIGALDVVGGRLGGATVLEELGHGGGRRRCRRRRE